MQKKKKTILRIDKVIYGTEPKEECFRKAFEPYFNKDKELAVSNY
ncbi:hypothetical protein [Sporolactobacillus shoreicorticis]|uniref:Uncharacterized protein n=1 Tax=Sporolactobacillus shoreicorticis TaxID=1923877 RepID=A0ABW5RXT7_9BACL|nr:hypothetical protein [Sporolactobacillus shoreicorticis]